MATNPIKLNALTLGAILALVMIAEAMAGWLINQKAAPGMLVIGLARVVQTGGILWIVVKWGGGLAAIGWSPAMWPTGLKKGALWSIGFALAAGMTMAIVYLAGVDPLMLVRSPLPSGKTELLLFFLVGGLIAPLAEEICFRGILYTFFRRWGVIFALIASTAIFVILHSVQGIPITQLVGGIVFALAYEITRNLMVPITIHALGNLAIFTLSLL